MEQGITESIKTPKQFDWEAFVRSIMLLADLFREINSNSELSTKFPILAKMEDMYEWTIDMKIHTFNNVLESIGEAETPGMRKFAMTGTLRWPELIAQDFSKWSDMALQLLGNTENLEEAASKTEVENPDIRHFLEEFIPKGKAELEQRAEKQIWAKIFQQIHTPADVLQAIKDTKGVCEHMLPGFKALTEASDRGEVPFSAKHIFPQLQDKSPNLSHFPA